MRKHKIAITADVGLDQELIAKLIHHHNAELLVIPKELSMSQVAFKDSENEVFEKHKEAHLKQVQIMMDGSDGLLLPGNKYDINPKHYGETVIHPETQKKLNPNPTDIRFDVEKKMLLCAIHKKIPIVAICGGMQVVNVVFGGTLAQHLSRNPSGVFYGNPSDLEEKMIESWKKEFGKHNVTGIKKNIFAPYSHSVRVRKNSMLGKIYEKYNATVDLNNIPELGIHHQGILKKNLASRLNIVATSYDDVVEAIELIGYPSLFIATQYHFEYNVGNIAYGIINQLVS